MATSKKPTPKKKVAAKPAKPTKPAAKAAPAKPVSAKTTAKPAAAKAPVVPAKPNSKPPMSTADIKRKLLERKSAAPTKAIAFSLDEVREIAKKNEKQLETAVKTGKAGKTASVAKPTGVTELSKPQKPNHVKTASLADILGFNPTKGKKARAAMIDESEVPDKYRRYYRLLLELRQC